MCVYMYVCAPASEFLCRTEEGTGVPRARGIDSFKSLNIDDGNLTLVLCKNKNRKQPEYSSTDPSLESLCYFGKQLLTGRRFILL